MRNKIKGEIVTYMVATEKIKILGGKNLPPLWLRFNRLQSTSNKLMGGLPYPKGVFRFDSHEDQEHWKIEMAINRPGHQRSMI